MPDVKMTPGNTDRKRYVRTGLSGIVIALVAAGASAPTIYKQFLDEKEGQRLVAYQDGVGIWTVCGGLTRINDKPVVKGQRLTREECDKHDAAEQASGLNAMERLVKPEVWAGMSPAAQAGTASFCAHNIGIGKCRTSTFLRLLNEGKRNEACAQITNWIRDGGKDCRKTGSNCQGQPVRRMQEDELCLL